MPPTLHLGIPTGLERATPFLTHPVFTSHHSETSMLRYIRRLGDRDIALVDAAQLRRQIGVVLGRAIAHEVGHHLLNTAGHARHGLMRARIDARDFADLRDGGFDLDDDAAQWARARLTRPPADALQLARFVYKP